MQKLSYLLDKKQSDPLYFQLYQQIRTAIHQQILKKAEKLPSKRQLAEYLQISQNTVESAYTQLVAEGYLEARNRCGFFVCFQAELGFSLPKKSEKPPLASGQKKIDFDLNPNHIDTQHFPFLAWQKLTRQSLKPDKMHLALGEKQGEWALRVQISDYLAASRGVQCDPEQIIIGAGLENCMQQLILLFNQQFPQTHFRYAMESYGYQTVEKLLHLYGKTITKLPLNENGQLELQPLHDQAIHIAYLTPSHLYPFGNVLPIGQRQQLLEWAAAAEDRYIIEDDYDSEFRYRGKPIPALQSLDQQQKVIYIGSFSKLLAPALRIGFIVLPKPLLKAYQHHCGFFNCAVSRFEQQRLALFIQQGDFERHIHRMRKRYRRKMELLCRLLSPHAEKIKIHSEHSGLYLLLELLDEQASLSNLAQQALAQKIKIYPLDYPQRKLIPIGFGNLTEVQLEQAISRLLTILLPKKT